jgi:hypothetical protein
LSGLLTARKLLILGNSTKARKAPLHNPFFAAVSRGNKSAS